MTVKKTKAKAKTPSKIVYLEAPYGGTLTSGNELFGYKSLDEVKKDWSASAYGEDLDGREIYEVQIIRKFKAKSNGITFQEVK